MRLTSKKIEEILKDILGEEGIPLVRQLIGKENVSEFDLATKTREDIKLVRKMLYILYNYNLVKFTRKKDKQKGWYIYYWTLLPDSIRFNYFKMKKALLERLKQQLEIEERELFFICPNDCVRLNFDQSMDFEFHCPECGELINQDEKKKRLSQLQRDVANTEAEVEKLTKQRKARRYKVKLKKKETKVKKKVVRKTKAKVSTKKKRVKKKVSIKKKTKVKKTAKKVVKKKIVKKKLVRKKAVKKKPSGMVKKKTVLKKTSKKKTKKSK